MFSKNKNKKYFSLAILFLIVLGGFLFSTYVSAQQDVDVFGGYEAEVGQEIGASDTDIRIVIARIIRIFFGILGIVALALILYGGFVWMTSGGNEERISTAKKILLNAAIGLVIALSAFGITQFILNTLLEATGVVTPGDGPEGPGPGPGFTEQDFYIREIIPTDEWAQENGIEIIKNTTVLIKFNKTVDQDTISENIKISKVSDESEVEGEFEVTGGGKWVKFRASAQCFDDQGQPVVDRQGNDVYGCFDADRQHRIKIESGLKSNDGKDIKCGVGKNSCEQFFTPSNILDLEPPEVSIYSFDPIQQGRYVPKMDSVIITAEANDDSYVTGVKFMVEDEDGVVLEEEYCATTGEGSDNCGGANPPFYEYFWDTSNLVINNTYTVRAQAFDLDDHDSVSSPKHVTIRSAHCFNGQQDEDEEDIDCGGSSCGLCSGGNCTSHEECASQACIGGVCIDIPIIYGLSPDNGAKFNYFTIWGNFFGDTEGEVWFLGEDKDGDGLARDQGTSPDNDDVKASLASCDGAWSNTEIVVEVPSNPPDTNGPILIIEKETGNDYYDDTENDRGYVGIFTVNNIQRPGICQVTNITNPSLGNSGTLGDRVKVEGINFGTNETNLFIGTTTSPESWSNNEVITRVPNISGVPKEVDVWISTEDARSNVKKFNALKGAAPPPFIDDITPNRGPDGQYVTISGSNFGTEPRKVEFSNTTFGSIIADVPSCEDYWNDSNIIIKVPEGIKDSGTSFDSVWQVKVINDNGSSNTKDFTYTSDEPTPGLCSISPVSGPISTEVTFSGENFGADQGRVEFFENQDADISSWVSAETKASVPDGSTSGFTRLYNSSDQASNPLDFKVGSCPVDVSCGVGFQCCNDGTCREECIGGPLSCSYIWDFFTGEAPTVPQVIDDPTCANTTQSPSPYKDSTNACLNALVSARFTTPIDGNTVNSETVILLECNSGDSLDSGQCAPENKVDLRIELSNDFGQNEGAFLKATPEGFFNGEYLKTNTWYKVILKGGNNGVKALNSLPLDTDYDGEPDGFNYIWYFNTQDEDVLCTFDKVITQPAEQTLNYNKATQEYTASVLNNGNCNLLPGFTYDWTWSNSNIEVADIGYCAVPDGPTATLTITTNQSCLSDLDCNKLNGSCNADALCQVTINKPCSFDSDCSGGEQCVFSTEDKITATAKNNGQTVIQSEADGKSDQGLLTVDMSMCLIDSDCMACGDGQSKCINGHCTPVIEHITPNDGYLGTWVNIYGCYFGDEKGQVKFLGFDINGDSDFEDKNVNQCSKTKSISCDSNEDCPAGERCIIKKINYCNIDTDKSCEKGEDCPEGQNCVLSDDKIGLWPDENLCGNTWYDDYIKVEVPDINTLEENDDLINDGPIMVITKNKDEYGQELLYNSVNLGQAGSFDRNDNIHPDICRLDPNHGKEGDTLSIKGQHFGDVGWSSGQFKDSASLEFKGEAGNIKYDNTFGADKVDGWSNNVVNVEVPYLEDIKFITKEGSFVGVSLYTEEGVEAPFSWMGDEDLGDGSYPPPYDRYYLNPYITSITPESGPLGTWLTISGGNFGQDRFVSGKSGYVTFGGEINDLSDPLPAFCGDVWNDDQIITKLPNNDLIESGLVRVKTAIGITTLDSDSKEFNRNDNLPIPPGICRLENRLQTQLDIAGIITSCAESCANSNVMDCQNKCQDNYHDYGYIGSQMDVLGDRFAPVVGDFYFAPQNRVSILNPDPQAPNNSFMTVVPEGTKSGLTYATKMMSVITGEECTGVQIAGRCVGGDFRPVEELVETQSNKIQFNLLKGLGDPCDTNDECRPPDNRCCDQQNLVCSDDPIVCMPEEVTIEEVYPENNSTEVCRNSLISATFGQTMLQSSINNNTFRVEYDCGSRPFGFIDSIKRFKNIKGFELFSDLLLDNWKNLLERAYDSFKYVEDRVKAKEALAQTVIGDLKIDKAITNLAIFVTDWCQVEGKVDFESLTGTCDLGEVCSEEDGVLCICGSGDEVCQVQPGDSSCQYANRTKAKFIINDLLPSGKIIRATIKGGDNGVKSSRGSILEKDFEWYFRTLSSIDDNEGVCRINYISINPDLYGFTNSRDNPDDNPDGDIPAEQDDSDSDKIFVSTANTRGGQKIVPIEGIYNWTWFWNVLDNSIIRNENIVNNPDKQNVIAQTKNGITVLEAVATITDDQTGVDDGKSFTGLANIEVFLCDYPWPSRGDFPYKDSFSNYSIMYCRGNTVPGNNLIINASFENGVGNWTISSDQKYDIVDGLFGEKAFKIESTSGADNFVKQPVKDLNVGGQYSLSARYKGASGSYAKICLGSICTTDDGFPAGGDSGSDSDWKVISITTKVEQPSLDVKFYADTMGDPGNYIVYDAIQLEEGDKPTDYKDTVLLPDLETTIVPTPDSPDVDCTTDNQCSPGFVCENSKCVSNVLKEFFFKNPVNNDVIGIRVMRNYKHQSVEQWAKNVRNVPPPGLTAPTKVKVDCAEEFGVDWCYEGLQEGRTIYINAANDSGKGCQGDEGDTACYTNVYVISYNNNASLETKDIYNQMVENWHFNINIDQRDKTKIIRDTVRWADKRFIKDLLTNYTQYLNTDKYPRLESGTFIPNFTFSTWPSWQAALGNELGSSLPVDPLNRFASCPVDQGFDEVTCWNEATGEFRYPLDPLRILSEDSYVYAYYWYQTLGGDDAYIMEVNSEYRGACIEGSEIQCGYSNLGQCSLGRRTCIDGKWSEQCVGEIPPANETCDGLDNDCDGRIDEDFDQDRDGYTTCGSWNGNDYTDPDENYIDHDDNNPDINPGNPEICDGVDNDGDGLIDANDQDLDPGELCPNQQGVCLGARQLCINGSWLTCEESYFAQPNYTVTEFPYYCDGLDNNCDGEADEGCECVIGETRGCSVDHQGICAIGTETCGNGAWQGCPDPQTEQNNGQDDDCDGLIDDIFDNDGDGYKPEQGDCDDSDPSIRPGAKDNCDGVDNNCDGQIDEITELGYTSGCRFGECINGQCILTNCGNGTIDHDLGEDCDLGISCSESQVGCESNYSCNFSQCNSNFGYCTGQCLNSYCGDGYVNLYFDFPGEFDYGGGMTFSKEQCDYAYEDAIYFPGFTCSNDCILIQGTIPEFELGGDSDDRNFTDFTVWEDEKDFGIFDSDDNTFIGQSFEF